ncbi:hypothetical protein [Kordiimonas lacus]|nr:hypothetical protein [Kordiimonas lacus]
MGSHSAESMDFCASGSRFWRIEAGLVAGRQQIIIHAGFHRCASTAVQDMLRARRTAIEATGTALLLREDLQGWLTGRQLRLLYRHQDDSLVSSLRLKLVASMLQRIRADRIVISEELLLGLMPGVRDPGFYPHFGNFMRAMKRLAKSFDVDLRLVARRPDRFLESAYAFRVRQGLREAFPDYVARIGEQDVSWLRLVREVERAGLTANTRFTCLESWPKERAGHAVLEFLGLDTVAGDTPIKLSGNPSWSADRLQATLEAPLQVAFTDVERTAFLSRLTADNAAFLAHPMVNAPADAWRD